SGAPRFVAPVATACAVGLLWTRLGREDWIDRSRHHTAEGDSRWRSFTEVAQHAFLPPGGWRGSATPPPPPPPRRGRLPLAVVHRGCPARLPPRRRLAGRRGHDGGHPPGGRAQVGAGRGGRPPGAGRGGPGRAGRGLGGLLGGGCVRSR